MDLLKAPQESIQALGFENNRIILLSLDRSEGKTHEELRTEIRENFGIHEVYVEKNQLESLEKLGLIKHNNTFRIGEKEVKKKYTLAPAGVIAVEFLKQMTQQFKPLDINITAQTK